QDEIRAAWRFGVFQNWLAVASKGAGENDKSLFAILSDGQFEPRRAENMPGVVRAHGEFRADDERLCSGDFSELLQSGLGFGDGVERQGRFVAAVLFLCGIQSVFFLQVSGVRKQKLAELARGSVGEDWPAKTEANETRQVAGVVDVRVGKEDPIDRSWIARQ